MSNDIRELHSVPHNSNSLIELSFISKATSRTKNHSINHLKSVTSKIRLSRIKSSAFKISSYAGPSVVAGIRDLSSTLIRNNNSSMNTTLNNSNRGHQLSISVLNDINTFDGRQGHKLDDWLADIENAATLVEENKVILAKGKARGLVQDLIKEHEHKPWPHIKEQLCNRLNNASIHTYTSRFMEIQQKDSEMQNCMRSIRKRTRNYRRHHKYSQENQLSSTYSSIFFRESSN